jgi:S-formylglutathione hydrolase FrmB
MKSILISVRNLKIFVILFITVVILHVIWQKITSPYGVQKVSFIPSKSENFTKGKLSFTIYKATSGVNEDVVYHFHGRNLDDAIWNDDTYYTSLIQSNWQKSNINPPTVVLVSYGSQWLLTPKTSKPESGLLEDFVSQLPFIESKIGKPRNRILLGESMGGLNVLILGLTHPELFSKIASLCPGVYLDSPFSDFKTMKKGLQRTGADPKIVYGIYIWSKKYVSNQEEFNAISPIYLINKQNANFPELYLSCGLYDKFGNYEGTEALANIAKSKGIKTYWHPIYGGHCATDINSLADFLITKE